MAHPGGLSRSASQQKVPQPAPRKPRSTPRKQRAQPPKALRPTASDCDFGVALCLLPAFRPPPKA